MLRNRHNYFTRSKLHGFLAQAAIQEYDNPTSVTHHAPHGPLLKNHVYHSVTGAKQSLDKLINGHDKITWTTSLSNELGRCAQGVGKTREPSKRVSGTNIIFFIPAHKVPQGQKVTYANFINDIRPLKSETHRVRMTVGGDKLDLEDDPGSPDVSLLHTKIMLNSVISDAHRGAKSCTADINFFISTTQ